MKPDRDEAFAPRERCAALTLYQVHAGKPVNYNNQLDWAPKHLSFIKKNKKQNLIKLTSTSECPIF